VCTIPAGAEGRRGNGGRRNLAHVFSLLSVTVSRILIAFEASEAAFRGEQRYHWRATPTA
jgi:hypothetical protein